MDDSTDASSGLARLDDNNQEHLVSRRESHDDADGMMRSILAAAIGLTSLGAPATSPSQTKGGITTTKIAVAAAVVAPQQPEP
eukprot:CAMPEP_0201936254 /NCGR_PEP_ID=MMETSP0903-20130614/37165_1 /ASSEMBLY_ACC=CAM_ASM_000552 /TAXON_ID=420261 /ORGANISM="Thalassiosira antarctica, Strain CCMP982" /LENGTH=82 /DNA_ID=CAMNT_0048476913 /DNA_START=235 /DNA_END=480 /DNA_ORIENTATION=+